MNHYRVGLSVIALAVTSATVTFTQTGNAAREAGRTIYGAGTNSCEQWTDARQRDTWFTAGQWILGFVSAANQYSRIAPVKATARDMARWVDDYCSTNSTSDVAAAAEALVELLVNGRQP